MFSHSSGKQTQSSVVVSVQISSDEYLKYYSGSARSISTRDIYGRSVHFPAGILQKFVTRQGISGVFEIFFDQVGKFSSVERLSE